MSTGRTCRAIVDIVITDEDIPGPMTGQMLVHCGEPAVKYQEGCAHSEDGWVCDEHYVAPEEWAAL